MFSYNLYEYWMHLSLRALVFVFIGIWNLNGREEGKMELYVQSGQDWSSTVVCYQINFLPTQDL
jgi:hypothetical protein